MLNSSLKTIEDLETYAENSVSPVYYLFLEAMGKYFFNNLYVILVIHIRFLFLTSPYKKCWILPKKKKMHFCNNLYKYNCVKR